MAPTTQQQQQPGGPAAPINARVARGISGLFGQSLLADCQLVFVQERGLLLGVTGQRPGDDDPHDGAASSSTRAWPGAQAGAPCGREVGSGQRCGEPMPAHSFVLRFASDKLAAQLDWPALSNPFDTSLHIIPKKAAAKAQLPILQLMVGGEEELPAARAAIQFAYTGRVEAGGGVREVLQVRRQAAYLQMEGCVEACLAAVREQLMAAAGGGAGAGAAGVSASTNAGGGAASLQQMPASPAVLELYSCSDVWPDPAEDAAFAALLTEAKPQLVAHFGDALAVLNEQQLYDQMRALPVEGMEDLLESDDFGTDSESSVVLVLAEWMAANHSRTDAATRKRLCGLLRLSQCSRSYLSWVLPALAAAHEASPGNAGGWLPMTRDDAICLLIYSTATEQERIAMTGKGNCAGSAAIQRWPARWLSTQRRRQCLTAKGRKIGFNVSLADLTKAFGGLKWGDTGRLDPILADTRLVDHFAAQGWEWSPWLQWASRDATAGVYVQARLPAALRSHAPAGAAATAGDTVLDGAVVAFPPLQIIVRGAGVHPSWSGAFGGSDVIKTGVSRGWPIALELKEAPADQPAGSTASGPNSSGSASSAEVAARWSRYLQHGAWLSGSVTLLPPPP